MRFVWAVVAFVVATLLIAGGIAQRTIFLGPDAFEAELQAPSAEPYLVIDSAVLRVQPGQQKLAVSGDDAIFVAIGRTMDVQGWLADVTHTSFTVNAEDEITAAVVPPVPVTAPTGAPGTPGETEAAEAAPGEEAAVPRPGPAGSDLWLEEFSAEKTLTTGNLHVPEGMSLLVASDGVAPAPGSIIVSWPLERSTPWAGPLITAGIVALLIGIVLYILGIRRQRRGRGPQRKGPGPLPPTAPIDVQEVKGQQKVQALPEGQEPEGNNAKDNAKDNATDQSRMARRLGITLPAIGLVAVLATGCSAQSWPQFGAPEPSVQPSPSPSLLVPEGQQQPAVTPAQAQQILGNITLALAEADEALDIDLAATRLSDAEFEARETSYQLRGKITDHPAIAAIPTESVRVLLPQAINAWPRTVMVLSEDTTDETIAPVILMMTQATPWENYRVSYAAEMRASAKLPDVAPAWLGTTLIPPDSPFLEVSPDTVAVAFSDLVDTWTESTYYSKFDQASLDLAESIRSSRQTVVQTLADNGASETSSATFDLEPSDNPAVALSSLDSGAIVAVSLIDTETVTATTEDAVIRFGDNAEAVALTGVTESASGVVTSYGMQLFFSVPSKGSSDPIRLLAVRQDLLGVKLP